jgi:hypothetical protein
MVGGCCDCGCKGDIFLITEEGSLEASTYGDDSIRAGHLELQIGVIWNNHELCLA